MKTIPGLYNAMGRYEIFEISSTACLTSSQHTQRTKLTMKISAILRLFLLSVALSTADGKGDKKEKGGKKDEGKGIKSGETKYVSDDSCAFFAAIYYCCHRSHVTMDHAAKSCFASSLSAVIQ